MNSTQVIFGDHDEKTLAQLADVDSRAVQTALMADGHLGYIMPIGGVAAYHNQVSVAGVGFDIACGNAAIRTNITVSDLSNPAEIADEIANTFSFGIGRTNQTPDAPSGHSIFESDLWFSIPDKHERDKLRSKARDQIGTIGSGNHYIDIFYDDDDKIWVGVHFGSRGLGHSIASGFMALYQGADWGKRVPEEETLLDLDTELGARYWDAMTLAGKYAYIAREWVVYKVVEDILGASSEILVHNHHNFAWREQHNGQMLVVIRKGATPAFPGQLGFVGGSMGDDAYIVRGAQIPEDEDEVSEIANLQRAAMYSTIHGAGRVMSRTAAKGKINRKTGEIKQPGAVTQTAMHDWLSNRGVILRGGDLDEAPQAYRRLSDVIDQQMGTIEICWTLHPWIVCMAGPNTFDPYKD